MVTAGELIPGDGEIVEGIASVDESAITGESAPVIRESGGDRSAVTGGTKVLSDWIKVRITAEPGRVLPRPDDPRWSRAPSARRRRTRSRCRSCSSKFTIIFLIVCVALQPFAIYAGSRVQRRRADRAVRLPDPDDDRRAAVGDRDRRDGPAGAAQRARDERPRRRGGRRRRRRCCSTRPARSPSATGRRSAFLPAPGVDERELAEVAQIASLADETPEGRSIVVLAKERYGLRERELHGDARASSCRSPRRPG